MACHTLPRGAAVDTLRCPFRVTATAQLVILLLQKWPDPLIGYMATHAQSATCVVGIVVVTENAVFLGVIEMRE